MAKERISEPIRVDVDFAKFLKELRRENGDRSVPETTRNLLPKLKKFVYGKKEEKEKLDFSSGFNI